MTQLTVEPTRSRTTTWEDPLELAAAAHTRSGHDFFAALVAGELPAPPISATLGMEAVEVDEGRVVFALEPAEHLFNPIGTVHGGVLSTLLDSALGCAVHTTLPLGTAYTTTDLQIRFVRPVTEGTGRLRCEGEVVHRGRTIATAEGRIVAEETGKLVAHGSATCVLFQTPGAPPR